MLALSFLFFWCAPLGESTLDVEYLYQLAQGANNYYTTIADGWAYTMALNLFNMADPPMVSSVS